MKTKKIKKRRMMTMKMRKKVNLRIQANSAFNFSHSKRRSEIAPVGSFIVVGKKDKDKDKKREKKKYQTREPALLLAFTYFDQNHTGYLLDKDVEEIIHTIGLQLSRAQVSYTYVMYNRIDNLTCHASTVLIDKCLY